MTDEQLREMKELCESRKAYLAWTSKKSVDDIAGKIYVGEIIDELLRCREALRKYADPENWCYYDESGCPKAIGESEESCMLGPTVAREALQESK